MTDRPTARPAIHRQGARIVFAPSTVAVLIALLVLVYTVAWWDSTQMLTAGAAGYVSGLLTYHAAHRRLD